MSDYTAGFMTGMGCALLAVLVAFVSELFRDHRDQKQQERMSEAWKREAWRHHDLR